MLDLYIVDNQEPIHIIQFISISEKYFAVFLLVFFNPEYISCITCMYLLNFISFLCKLALQPYLQLYIHHILTLTYTLTHHHCTSCIFDPVSFTTLPPVIYTLHSYTNIHTHTPSLHVMYFQSCLLYNLTSSYIYITFSH